MSKLQPMSNASMAPIPTSTAMPDVSGKVLLVEDEPAIARMLTRLFSQAGLHVIPAGDASEGIAVAERNAEDIVLAFVDCHGADVENQEFCRRVRSLRPNLPVVLAGNQERGLSENALTMFITRPYLPTDLVWKLRSLIVGVAA